jgi:ABC-2 type transport system permease protein
MKRMLMVAEREFLATVATKGFLIGMLLVPLLLTAAVVLLPVLTREEAPVLSGELAVRDASGRVGRIVVLKLAERARAEPGLELRLVEVAPSAKIENEKRMLVSDGPRLAFALIDADAVVRASGKPSYGAYQLFVRKKLDDRVERAIDRALHDAVVAGRAEAQGLDPADVERLVSVSSAPARTLTAEGEHDEGAVFHALLPMVFMLLLFMSVMVSGQYLMTTTIEEKSSRVIEVLLSAVSSLELMTGKILGQLGVALLTLSVYGGIGLVSLARHGLLPLLDPVLVVYLLVFFLLAYFVVASLMAAIGAAVSELRDAQALLTPVILVLMIQWLLAAPISRDPSSPLSVSLSFLPPLNSLAMLMRVASTSPPPAWQVWLSIAIGAASVWAALWFAAKVFRVGLLLHGKPPSFSTLLRWAREA